ncbi:juvenile hormone epoxide hydrolase 1 [Venturia canescens]|uniref:juvenile hormone epoxide hydrolase 1 n=1 Tax=Venturia canescens TaxID=32260 RepID=UPI001C9D629A|nr:juvenile hormone epoxide hydrolase 1 [Venturia canescens]
MLKVAGLVFLLGLGVTYVFDYLGSDADIEVPKLQDTYWGPLEPRKVDNSIRPFKIDVPSEVITKLKNRLAEKRNFVPPLEGTAWEYGISGKYMETVLEYWRTKYDWTKRQALLNKYPQFLTTIQGLDIHFLHVKPQAAKDGKKRRVLPLLIVHGWPGSVVEFQKIIPMLTTPREDQDYVFEVIAPSLPGYGFSDGAVRPGLGPAQMGVILKNLMTRLGFKRFYIQGGDWGSIITSTMASMFPDLVIGSHMNMCYINNAKTTVYKLVASYYPSLIVSDEYASRMFPLKDHLSFLLRESGYMHLQATKPDTIGNSLVDSPSALATYILEKFSTWTNPEYVSREDGGLLEKFTMDELLDNVMIYWLTNSITTSMRLYAECFNWEYQAANWDKLLVKVPSACAAFPNELTYAPEKLLKFRYKNLVQHSHPARGGHFAAFEEPKLLADDVWSFVEKVENPKELSK